MFLFDGKVLLNLIGAFGLILIVSRCSALIS